MRRESATLPIFSRGSSFRSSVLFTGAFSVSSCGGITPSISSIIRWISGGRIGSVFFVFLSSIVSPCLSPSVISISVSSSDSFVRSSSSVMPSICGASARSSSSTTSSASSANNSSEASSVSSAVNSTSVSSFSSIGSSTASSSATTSPSSGLKNSSSGLRASSSRSVSSSPSSSSNRSSDSGSSGTLSGSPSQSCRISSRLSCPSI